METLLSIILFVFGILQIILFFKIWEMTNDVSKMRRLIESYCFKNNDNSSTEDCEINTNIKINDIVMDIKTRKEFRVKQIVNENEYECIERYGCVMYTFKRDDIKFVGSK